MLNLFYLLRVLLLSSALSSPLAVASYEQIPALVPLPLKVIPEAGSIKLGSNSSVQVSARLPDSLAAVRLLLGPATGFEFPAAQESASIRIVHDDKLQDEGYKLQVTRDRVIITASAATGVFYALQTLRQLLPPAIYSKSVVDQTWTLPAITIEDEPRFKWRGMHLDVGRHFKSVDFVKKFIDLLALHKFNSFHWHLTEDQGWRIEIKQYPKLTEVGSRRAQTVVGHSLFKDEDEQEYDGVPHAGFYTQEQIREVVAYAATRHVNVVPEIEFPGHAQAAIAAYPELGNTGKQLKVREAWGISKNTIKPSEATLDFYRNVLHEVMELFPSPYIHIGGDEAPKDQWEESAYAQQRIQELGLANEHELQSWLIQQIDNFLTENNRQLVGWDEIMQGGLSSNATVMSWRGVKPGLKAAERGHNVIMAPTRWTYLDYYQADASVEPLAIGSYLPLADVYSFDPAPAKLSIEVRNRILGAQGQLWSEFMPTEDHVEYMAYPRAAALAEVVWTPQQGRNYEDFQKRLPTHLQRLKVLGVNYRPLGNDALTFSGRIRQGLLRQVMSFYFWWID